MYYYSVHCYIHTTYYYLHTTIYNIYTIIYILPSPYHYHYLYTSNPRTFPQAHSTKSIHTHRTVPKPRLEMPSTAQRDLDMNTSWVGFWVDSWVVGLVFGLVVGLVVSWG